MHDRLGADKSLLPSLFQREELPLFGKEGAGEIVQKCVHTTLRPLMSLPPTAPPTRAEPAAVPRPGADERQPPPRRHPRRIWEDVGYTHMKEE